MSFAMRRTVISTAGEERKVQKALRDNSLRFRATNNVINKFRREKEMTIKSKKVIEWKKLFSTLQYEEKAITHDLQSISKEMDVGGTDTATMTYHQLESTSSQILEGMIGKPSKEKNDQLAALKAQLLSEFDLISKEANALRELMRHNDTHNNNTVPSSRLHLPAVVAKRLDDIKKEFKFAKYIASDIELVTNQLEENFERCSNDQLWERSKASWLCSDNYINDTIWDDESQMILRNAIKQWSKTPTNHDKQMFLHHIAKETGNDIKVCRHMWRVHISQKGRGNSKARKGRQRNELTNMAMEDIDKMRQDIIHELVSDVQRHLNNEIGIESHHRLWLLQRLRAISEVRKRDDENKRQVFQYEEQCLLSSKKQSEIEAARQKLQVYLKEKKNEILQARVEEMETMKKEKIARAQRLAMNSERTQFRHELIKTRAEMNHERKERSARERIVRDQYLNALAASVPYHSAIKNVKSNIEKSTASRMNDIYEPCSDTGLSEFQMGKMTGFTNARVFSDPKFRLGFALHEKGIASTAYSIAVVKRLIPREAERTTGIEPH